MADMLHMDQIRGKISEILQSLGYRTSCRGFNDYRFEMNGGHNGDFEIGSANIKRFEITVGGPEEDFLIPSRLDPERSARRVACRRFTKREDAIPEVLEWVSTALKSHQHLNELLHPERPPSGTYGFTNEGFLHESSGCTYFGTVHNVQVHDIVTLQGRKVVHTAYDPAMKPYFLVTVSIRPRMYNSTEGIDIISDGDMWLPAIKIQQKGGSREHRVFMDTYDIAKLRAMNKHDRDLIHAALSHYVDVNFSDSTSPTGT